MTTLALLLLSILPPPEPLRESFDCIDVNTVYSETGELIFVQFLFLDFVPLHSHHEIHAWRLQKNEAAYPVRDGDGWLLVFRDGEYLRVVRAKSCHWTAEIGDKELWSREQFPLNHRRELVAPWKGKRK